MVVLEKQLVSVMETINRIGSKQNIGANATPNNRLPKRLKVDIVPGSNEQNNLSECIQETDNPIEAQAFNNILTLKQDFEQYFKISCKSQNDKSVEFGEINRIKSGPQAYIVKSQCSTYLATKIATQCLQSGNWYLLALLIALSECISSSSVPTLIDTLVKEKRVDMIPIVTRYMIDISPKDLGKLLRFTIDLQLPEKPLENQQQQNTDLLDWVLSYPVDGQLVGPLHSIEFSIIQRLLDHIFFYIERYLRMEYEIVPPERQTMNSITLPLEQLVQWTALILDSHFTRWVQIPDQLKSKIRIMARLKINYALMDHTKAFFSANFVGEVTGKSLGDNSTYSIYTYDI